MKGPDCRTCEHGHDEGVSFADVEAVDCHAPWVGQAIAMNVVELADAGFLLPMPFACSFYKRGQAQPCGCDRGERHTCRECSSKVIVDNNQDRA